MIKKIIYSCFLIALIFSAINSYSQKKESYQQQKKQKYSKLNSSSRSYSRVNEVQGKLSEAKKIFKKEPEKALDLVHDGLLIAIKENYLNLEAEAYQILGLFNYELNEYSLSYKNYKKAIAIYENMSLVSTKNFHATSQLINLYYPTGKAAVKLSFQKK